MPKDTMNSVLTRIWIAEDMLLTASIMNKSPLTEKDRHDLDTCRDLLKDILSRHPDDS